MRGKKKKLLFVIDSLDTAGAEKSLVTLLNLLDYSKYDVDLQLFAYGFPLEELVPKEVTILPPIAYTIFAQQGLWQASMESLRHRDFRMLQSRVKYSLSIRKGAPNNPQKAMLFWQHAGANIEQNQLAYDVAISYAQGVPTYYVAEKVKAQKKYAWVNVSYSYQASDRQFQQPFYERFTKIIAVSESTKSMLAYAFPDLTGKLEVIHDINNPQFIEQMSKLGVGFDDGFDGIRILTVGRLANQKGYDIAIDACRRLKEQGIHFRWYVLGKGPLEAEIKQWIKSYDLENHFILLGVKANPYPYFRDATFYVQTSRFEGFGLAIAEARMLNIPVVTTRFDAVFNQMRNRKNGLVVDMNGKAVSDGIIQLLQQPDLKNQIMHYLHQEKKGNVEEMNKFYQLIS